jgi:hypothetical protein
MSVGDRQRRNGVSSSGREWVFWNRAYDVGVVLVVPVVVVVLEERREMAERPEIDLPFRWEWRGPDLGSARPASLYGNDPLESLPPIPALDGTLSWLATTDPVGRVSSIAASSDAWETWDAQRRDALDQVQREATALGLTLPPAFTRLMGSSALLDRFPEYAGSWFPLLEHLTPCIFGGRGRLVCFLRDQQDCVVWHLYLTPDGGEFVVSSWEAGIDAAIWGELNDGVPPDDKERDDVLEFATICATSFEDFLYRLWLEIRISYKVGGFDDAPLTDAERRYLAHYESGQHRRVT